MAQTINLNAEQSGNMISDDAEPALTLSNTSTGPGLRAFGMVATSTASVDAMTLGGPILAAAATITNFNLNGASRASGAVLALKGDAFVSVGSIDFGAGSDWAGTGAVRVALTDGTFGWIPILPDAALETPAVPA